MTDTDAQDHALLQLARTLRQQGYRFITPTPMTHSRVNSRPQNRRAEDAVGVFGWSRPFAADLLPAQTMELMTTAGILEPKNNDHWQSALRLSSLAGELFWHSAFPTDAPDAVFFGPDTYRYANALRDWLARHGAGVRRAVDIGSGSGAGAVLIARECPEAEVLAVDINPAALRLTRLNAELAGVRLKARHSDLLDQAPGEFDLIIANPPYLIDPSERAYRHGGGPLGAGLSLRIVEAALPRLSPGGTLLLYTGVAMQDNRDPLLQEITQRLEGRDLAWQYRELDPDVFGEELLDGVYTECDRIAAVLLEVTRPAAR
ncbi:class I SAM-dependent methyltransferase [Stutzerimonas urumqiensis]|uniref:methyltransferase n=1 Tax=Stutzerimonas urumqiensis TaxID=638269 RepID=UPI003DA58555